MSAERRTVLLVDDVADLRMLTRLVLAGTGRYEVIAEAADGVEAIEAAGLHQPDLVLLDAAMPRMDGLEALGGILGAAPGTAVVMVSAFDVERLGSEATRLGAAGYIEKGESPDAFVDQLDRILGTTAVPVPVPRAPFLGTDTMLDVVAHDLRTPISVISGFVGVLEQNWDALDEADVQRIVRRIGAQNRMMEMLTTNLLTDDDRLPRLMRSTRTVEIGEVLRRLADSLADIANTVPLTTEIQEGLGAVAVDEAALTHVLCNLVSNAARHGRGTERIELVAAREGDEIVISVVDHGPGVPADMRTAVFDRHVRLSNHGLGLGLHSCALFLEALGGRIWVEETPAGGATFRFSLPLAVHETAGPGTTSV